MTEFDYNFAGFRPNKVKAENSCGDPLLKISRKGKRMTRQAGDVLIMNGKAECLMMELKIPFDDNRIVGRLENEFADEDYRCFATSCYRRYISTWEIKDGKLFLVKVIGAFRLNSADPVLADWITGKIFISHGEYNTEYFISGLTSNPFEKGIQLQIESGVVKLQREHDISHEFLAAKKSSYR